MADKNNGGFYLSKTVSFEPNIKKNDKKAKGDKKDGKEKGKGNKKQKN